MYNDLTPEERKKSNFRLAVMDKVGWLVFVLILGLFSSGLLLGVTYLVPAYGEGLDLEGKLLILKVLGLDYDTTNIEENFAENVVIEEIDDLVLYKAANGRVAFNFEGMGFQDNIKGLLSLDPVEKKIGGLVILEQQETPGLGGRISEEAFLEQFKGLVFEPQIVILPTGRTASKPYEVDGITGATMTGNALEAMLRKNIANVLRVLEGD
ncbi:MAG TPA: FMN-binding protein [Firmicutes bacterium]|nr:FMN-binding protein [Bacillota bacterium]